MNLAQVARILAGFTLFFSATQAIPLVFALFVDDPQTTKAELIVPVRGFSIGIGAGICTAVLFWVAGRRATGSFFRKEGLAVVGAAWFIAGVLGAIPFHSSAAMPTAADSIFESISGLTTTGATVLGGPGRPAIEDLPESLLLWRAMLQWLGGLGIILVFIVLLPAMGVTGKNLLSSEQVGVSNESLRPRMREQARSLFRVYVTLTVLAVLIYSWITGEIFDSVCHAFTTLSSGGFSTKNASIFHYDSIGMELATTVFMFLAGCNFVLLLTSARGGFQEPMAILKNPEFRLYLLATVSLILLCSVFVWAGSVLQYTTCLRDASFTVVSMLTSTGYSTADFERWPAAALLLLMFCMFVGGCSGSTAGGIKQVRLLVLVKIMAYNTRHFIRPKSVEKIRVGHTVVPNSIVAAILGMLVLWVVTIMVGTLLLSLDTRLTAFDCFAMNLSAVGCTGPGITALHENALGQLVPVNPAGLDFGPVGSYGGLQGWGKILLSLQMVLGRLELLVPLALFAPTFWRR